MEPLQCRCGYNANSWRACAMRSRFTILLVLLCALVLTAQVRITVGGNVQASKIVSRVAPVYPDLARQARIQGIVRLEAIISIDGRVTDLKVISGHPLMVQAALDAVQQ